ncbi:MAG: ABC transporter ATP-binding protein [Proteobacteria bacterium]|nr:ABC transporter ATP-binding protein [Pseudomonadota bacterium]MDA0852220.1 ABC transporter ATP-binding protein [Pseudomonadota bacterium]MDA1295655.1 ABC transporter ATP-binding protein [Pseudomonadota bacterium]
MTELLSIKGLNKSYGGVKATDDLNLSIREGELHAIIGPNGAGKTTLISQLSGNVTPDSGTVHFAGRDITRMSEHKRPHLGMSRTYQITSLIRSMSVLDNLQLAIQAQAGHSFRFWSDVRKRQTVRDRAGSFAKEVGLEDQLHARVDNLAHGEQRRLEVAMALTSNSRLLLLDEPLAGLGGQEAAEMIDLLQSLKGQKTMLLIEHDMDAVFTLADRISVLVYGHIIATDQPEQIRLNVEVQQAYLGEG